jgi:hypothetical protein
VVRVSCRLVYLLLLLLLGALSISAKVGEVVEVSGKAEYTVDGLKWNRVVKGLSVSEKTTIRTGYTGLVKVSFVDGSVLWVRTHTTVKFGDFVVTEKEVKGSVRILYGKLRMLVTKTGKKKRIKVESKTATIGVKGTEFSVFAGESWTVLITHEGLVEVLNKETGERVLVPAGFRAVTGGFGTEVVPVSGGERGSEGASGEEEGEGERDDVNDFSFGSGELPPPPSADRGSEREGKDSFNGLKDDASSSVSEVQRRLVEIEVRFHLNSFNTNNMPMNMGMPWRG